ncbi:MAG: hypothetical protein ABIQ90_01595 [Polaromonas sp.]
MSRWLSKFFKPACELLITSDEIVLTQGGQRIACAVLHSPTPGETVQTCLVRTLKTVLDQACGVNGRSANVWLSHRLVPHSVVEIDARAMNASEIAAMLKSWWEDLLDLPATTLAVTYQVQSCGRSIVTSCCDLALMEAIQSTLQLSGWTAKNIAPHVTKIWNESRQQFHNDDGYLLLLEDQVLSIGAQQNGRWIAWTSEVCDSAEWPELAERTTRFCRSTGLSDAASLPVWVHAPQIMGTPVSAGLKNWSVIKPSSDSGLHAGSI